MSDRVNGNHYFSCIRTIIRYTLKGQSKPEMDLLEFKAGKKTFRTFGPTWIIDFCNKRACGFIEMLMPGSEEPPHMSSLKMKNDL